MTDREMLELAAKAYGVTLEYRHGSDAYYYDDPETGREVWEPPHNDGQALRLAVKLRLLIELGYLSVQVKYNYDEVEAWSLDDAGVTEIVRDFDGKSGGGAATRRAITRAAAEIGKSMGEQA